jgi:hypothetical protein
MHAPSVRFRTCALGQDLRLARPRMRSKPILHEKPFGAFGGVLIPARDNHILKRHQLNTLVVEQPIDNVYDESHDTKQ